MKENTRSQWWRIRSRLLRECLAEVAGTFVMMAFINGGSAQVVLGENKKGDYLASALGAGIAVMLGIHTAGGISGAHLNPSISIAMAFYGRFPWRKVPYYAVSQFIGAILGSLVAYIIFYPAIMAFDPDLTINKTAGIFATYPISAEFPASAFVCEMVATSLLVFTIFSVDDTANMPAHPAIRPLTVGLIVSGIVLSFGMPTGVAMNPARDLSPRLFTALAGWGFGVFTASNHYFWVPLTAPIVGAILGGGAYIVVVSNHHSKEDDLYGNYFPELTSPVV
ncbi:unnamed protein product [Aphanomyces euteiches]|uniref:Aquaporin n=1 Tax=Aphanomyces euteiches TaxID=100861 RepID=A0A6G0WYF3_9STRA|nr:hypothetical protein Ae201684_010290 [Aphanomyces euteiches]KAH9090536.1 hypothetical protein Ae201684P_014336 [Aphanomyces euteiches]KAH9148502.1 hypothetical protein AeRB84_008165 [Aphanomyces euteiches]